MNYTNKVFWFDLTPRIFRVHYAKPVAKQDLMATRMIDVVDSLDSSSKCKHGGPTVEIRSIRKKQKAKEMRNRASETQRFVQWCC